MRSPSPLSLPISLWRGEVIFFCETGCFIQYERVSGVARYKRAAQEKNPWISIFRVTDEEAGRPTLPQGGWYCKHTYLSNRNSSYFGEEFEKKDRKAGSNDSSSDAVAEVSIEPSFRCLDGGNMRLQIP